MDVVVDFEWKNLVIGADLDAVKFAHENDCFLIKNRAPHHHSYENVEEAWAKMLYQLYESARAPFVDKPRKIKINPSKKIVEVFTSRGHFVIKYTNLHLYDDDNVEGASLNRKLAGHRVIDWFDCRGLSDLQDQEIITKDNFVQKITFFKSPRIDGNQRYLDLLCESILVERQLKSFEYGETMARFKITEILKENGLKNPRMTFWKRDIYPVYDTI